MLKKTKNAIKTAQKEPNYFEILSCTENDTIPK